MRASRSDAVVQVIEVPAELTKGRAAQISPEAHATVTNLPPAHCANLEPTQAVSPAVQEELSLRPANLLLRAMASWPFCFVNEARDSSG